MGNKLGAFLAGGLAGAVIALLYAPRSGQETRAMVTDKMNNAWGEAQELGAQASANAQHMYQEATAKGQDFAQNVAEKGQQFASAAQSKGQELYGAAASRVQEAAENIKPAFSEKNDELREKIEAARQRIASQVAKNAEAAQGFADTAKDKADQAAEKIATDETSANASSIDAPAPCDAPPGQPCHSETK